MRTQLAKAVGVKLTLCEDVRQLLRRWPAQLRLLQSSISDDQQLQTPALHRVSPQVNDSICTAAVQQICTPADKQQHNSSSTQQGSGCSPHVTAFQSEHTGRCRQSIGHCHSWHLYKVQHWSMQHLQPPEGQQQQHQQQQLQQLQQVLLIGSAHSLALPAAPKRQQLATVHTLRCGLIRVAPFAAGATMALDWHNSVGAAGGDTGRWAWSSQPCRSLHQTRQLPLSKRSPAPAKPKPLPAKSLPRRNHQITAMQLMVVFPDGTKQVLELTDARLAAKAMDLDLVEVNPRADPPIARVMDWGKVAHGQALKREEQEKARRRQEKLSTPKEMQFSARIADHDLEVKLKKVTGFLEQGFRVQLVVKHKREEDAAAQEALDYLLARIQADYDVDAGAKQVQRRAVTLLVKPLGHPVTAAAAES